MPSLITVKKQIEPMVKNRVKGKMLTDKFAAALNGSPAIDQVAQKVGGKGCTGAKFRICQPCYSGFIGRV